MMENSNFDAANLVQSGARKGAIAILLRSCVASCAAGLAISPWRSVSRW